MAWFTTKQTPAFSIVMVGLLMGLSVCSQSDVAQDNEAGEQTLPLQTEKVSVLPLEDLRVFTKAYDHIRNAYVEEIDDKTLLEYAIRGMLQQLDPHSAYLDEESSKELQEHTTGQFGGLGIEVGMDEGFVRVVSPIDDTPAARAGVEAGDLIIKLDGITVKGLTLSEAVKKMRGPKGSDIILTVVREGVDKPFDLKITRDIIKVRSVSSKLIEDDFAYIRIAQFQLRTADDVKKGLAKMQEQNADIKGLVLDLRNNPGGLLQAAVEVSDLFLQSGKIVYTEGRIANSNTEYTASPGDVSEGLPIVVLINGGSASASEIVAGALQDHRRALLIGTQSFGKGSVQTIIPVTETKNVKITTALYFTPSGSSIQAQGIVPDITVERVRITAVKKRNGVSEADLSGHIKNAKGGKDIQSKDKKVEESAQELFNRDSQLYEALNLLKGIHLLSQRTSTAELEQPTDVVGDDNTDNSKDAQ